MKKGIFPRLILTFALVALGAACSQTANDNHSTTNHNSMNHNATPMNSSAANSNMMNSNMTMNHDSKSHSGMQSDANAANAPYDLQFIDTMTHHHEGAIEMAEMALRKSQNEELKRFAQKIVDDQRREIQEMTDWRKQWFGGDAPAAKNMQMPGMADSMKMMTPEHMKMMGAMSGAPFDTHFLEMMIPHHQGAVVMAKEAQQKSQKAEIKTLAGEIIKAQDSEIKQMNDWKAKWTK
jgi:uncharacterized protein (DUF305 family)